MVQKCLLLLISLSVYTLMYPLPSARAGAPAPRAAEAAQLLQDLQASACRTRVAAIRSYLVLPGDRLMSLRQAAGAVEDSLKSRTELIIQFLEEEARLHERTRQFATQFVEARFQYARDQDAAKRTAALERAGWDLLAMVTNPQEPFLMRWSAARYLSYEGARQDHADTLSWIPELPKLLGSGDTRSRLIAALLAGRRWLHREQAPEKGVVIPELIQGLSGETFQERDESYSVLVAVTERSTESFCVDPTDLPELRAKGIAVWERWWEANRDALAQERLPGRW